MTTSVIDPLHRQLAGVVAARRGEVRGAGRELVVGLVGRGIQASKTPRMHEFEGRRMGLGYTYVLFDFDTLGIGDEELGRVLSTAEALGLAGLNVTFPFKQAVIPLLDDLAPEASAIGAVNTVVFSSGRRLGHNTDCWGFAENFRDGLPGANLDRVVQFGAGGAGAAVGHALLSLGVQHLTLCETDMDRARLLASRLSARFGRPVMAESSAAEAIAGATGIVNTTPVGMAKFPGTPFAAHLLRPAHWVAEIIYFPPETALLRRARELGCRTLPGAGMAVCQAVNAFELFTGIAPDRAAMSAHFAAA